MLIRKAPKSATLILSNASHAKSPSQDCKLTRRQPQAFVQQESGCSFSMLIFWCWCEPTQATGLHVSTTPADCTAGNTEDEVRCLDRRINVQTNALCLSCACQCVVLPKRLVPVNELFLAAGLHILPEHFIGWRNFVDFGGWPGTLCRPFVLELVKKCDNIHRIILLLLSGEQETSSMLKKCLLMSLHAWTEILLWHAFVKKCGFNIQEQPSSYTR